MFPPLQKQERGAKREAGGSPARSRHCNGGAIFVYATET